MYKTFLDAVEMNSFRKEKYNIKDRAQLQMAISQISTWECLAIRASPLVLSDTLNLAVGTLRGGVDLLRWAT